MKLFTRMLKYLRHRAWLFLGVPPTEVVHVIVEINGQEDVVNQTATAVMNMLENQRLRLN